MHFQLWSMCNCNTENFDAPRNTHNIQFTKQGSIEYIITYLLVMTEYLAHYNNGMC